MEYSPAYITRLELRLDKVRANLQRCRDRCVEHQSQLVQIRNERQDLGMHVIQLENQHKVLLEDWQELNQEKAELESRYIHICFMNRSLLQILSKGRDVDVSGLERLLVEHGKQQYTIDGLRDQLRYQEAQVRAAMCFLRNVQSPYSPDDDTDSEATTTLDPNRFGEVSSYGNTHHHN
jgi:chromosome segregation ATPase